ARRRRREPRYHPEDARSARTHRRGRRLDEGCPPPFRRARARAPVPSSSPRRPLRWRGPTRGHGGAPLMQDPPVGRTAADSNKEGDPRPDRNLAMELVRVTEAAALAAGRWIGRGDKNRADKAAVDAMRLMIDS